MIDPISRPDRFGAREAPEPRNLDELVQARIDRRLSRREMIRKATVLGFAVPAIATMLHASSDLAFGAPTARAQGAELPNTDQPTAPEGTAQEGGTVIAGTAQEPDTLNPYVTQLVTGGDAISGVFDSLLTYDAKGEIQPGLATEYSISDDGLTYTFTLREGVKYHNGDAFTGDDVVNSWKMIMNPDFGAYNQNGWDKVKTLEVSDDKKSVIFTIEESYAPFLSYLAYSSGSICPSSELAKGPEAFKQDFGRNPIGTGFLKFVEWQPKQQITYAKNADYWGEPAHFDTFVYRIVPDDNTILVQLQTGELDLIGSATFVPPSRVDEALGFQNMTIFQHSTLSWQHIDLKNIGFMRHPKVRQAMDFATPTKDIIEKLLKGRAAPSIADQPFGSSYNNTAIQPRPYDLEQAKALLAEAGLTMGADNTLEGPTPTTDPLVFDGPVAPFTMELWYSSGSADSERICQVVAQSWTSIGIKTEVKTQDVSTIWGPEGYQWNEKLTGCLYTWTNGNDPTDTFYWNSTQIPDSPTGSGGNATAYFFPYNFQDEIDELTNAGDAETDPDKRKDIYFQIQELLHEQVPVIFMYWEYAFPAAKKDIGGFQPNAFTSLFWNANKWQRYAS